jgi:hypothetical protein
MVKETGELNSLGSYCSRYSLSPKGLWRKTGAILKNFHPAGEPIWPHPLRCGPFAVPQYSFMARRLAAAAGSTREISGLGRRLKRNIDHAGPFLFYQPFDIKFNQGVFR